MRATKALIAGVFGRAAPAYERAGPPSFSEVTRRRLREAGVANAAVLVMDAEVLGFRAGSFDAVLCASALYLLPHPVAALRGFRRVLRPGGRLAVAVFEADLNQRWSWRGELLARLAPPLEPLGRRFDEVSLRQALEEAGFREVAVEVERLDVAYADAATWSADRREGTSVGS